MRSIGIVLIIAGIVMLAFNGFDFTTKKKVVDLGTVEINKEENHHIGWPLWTGGVALLAGIGLVGAGRKR